VSLSAGSRGTSAGCRVPRRGDDATRSRGKDRRGFPSCAPSSRAREQEDAGIIAVDAGPSGTDTCFRARHHQEREIDVTHAHPGRISERGCEEDAGAGERRKARTPGSKVSGGVRDEDDRRAGRTIRFGMIRCSGRTTRRRRATAQKKQRRPLRVRPKRGRSRQSGRVKSSIGYRRAESEHGMPAAGHVATAIGEEAARCRTTQAPLASQARRRRNGTIEPATEPARQLR